jgi:hypothetical protein
MTKASDLLEKLKQRREEAEAVRAYWADALPSIGTLPEPQLQGWLQRFNLDIIIGGIDAAVILRSKRDAKGEKLPTQEAVDYASKSMHEAHFEAMPEEERQKYAEKAAHIREVRSAAARKRWDKVASVSTNLHGFASPLHTEGEGDGDGASGFDLDLAHDGETASATTTAASPPTLEKRDEKQHQTKTNTDTHCPHCLKFTAGMVCGCAGSRQANRALGERANQEQTQNQKTNTNTNGNGGPRTCSKCGHVLHRDRDHKCHKCSGCGLLMIDYRDPNAQCQRCQRKKAKAIAVAVAAEDFEAASALGESQTLGNVDEL